MEKFDMAMGRVIISIDSSFIHKYPERFFIFTHFRLPVRHSFDLSTYDTIWKIPPSSHSFTF